MCLGIEGAGHGQLVGDETCQHIYHPPPSGQPIVKFRCSVGGGTQLSSLKDSIFFPRLDFFDCTENRPLRCIYPVMLQSVTN